MAVSAIILIATFAGIFTEAVHGLHRVKFAMAGAGLMIICGQYFGFYDSMLAVKAVDWNVVFLLGAMMAIVAIMIPTGGFQHVAYRIADFSGRRPFVLVATLGTLVTALSLLLDNVTTVVIFGPLIILIFRTLNLSPIPCLMAAALLTDTGGVATLVGDPPNLMIGSAAEISFNQFVYHMGGIVVVAWIAILISLRGLFRKELAVQPTASADGPKAEITDRRTWNVALAVLGGMVVLFILHDRLHWNAWFVAGIGLTALVFIAPRVQLDETFAKIELSLLLFFISLFILVGGVQESGFLQYIAQLILPFVEHDLMTASVILLWGTAFLSAAIDNIPMTAAVIPIISSMELQGINVTPLWWALAVGVGMGGNGTHVGSTANVFIVTISERLAKETGNDALRITPGLWFRKGTPAMIVTLITSTVLLLLFWNFLSRPLQG